MYEGEKVFGDSNKRKLEQQKEKNFAIEGFSTKDSINNPCVEIFILEFLYFIFLFQCSRVW